MSGIAAELGLKLIIQKQKLEDIKMKLSQNTFFSHIFQFMENKAAQLPRQKEGEEAISCGLSHLATPTDA